MNEVVLIQIGMGVIMTGVYTVGLLVGVQIGKRHAKPSAPRPLTSQEYIDRYGLGDDDD